MSGNLVFGQDRTTNSIHSLACDSNGHLDVNIASATGTHGLATEAKQDDIIADLTDGTQLARCMGSEDPNDPAGTQLQLHVDGNGNVLSIVSNTVNTAPSNDNNSILTNTVTKANSVGLYARTDVALGSSTVPLKCSAAGVLEVSSSGGGGGDATAANQTLQLAQETVTATNSSSIDNKISQGSDVTLTNAQQVLCYGRDSGGTLDALLTDASGHLEVVVDDFVKGQATMANSFPVVIASDQARVDVQPVRDEVVISQVSQTVINPATFTSTGVDMRGYKHISFFGTSTNNADMIYVLQSADDITYYTTGEFVQQDFTSGDFTYNATIGARYLKLQQASGDFGGNFTITCISSKK